MHIFFSKTFRMALLTVYTGNLKLNKLRVSYVLLSSSKTISNVRLEKLVDVAQYLYEDSIFGAMCL
jgi:hypothetical protein